MTPFVRWSRPKQAVTIVAGLVVSAAVWTAVASQVFLLLSGLAGEFDLPEKLWQWWLYLPYYPQNGAVRMAIQLGGIAGTAPFALLIFMLYQRRQQIAATDKPLYGKTRPATRDAMRRSGINIRPKL